MPKQPELGRISVDRVLCTGHGICAQTLPGAIVLDEWGYPTIVTEQVEPDDAATAIKLCPARALFLR
jgi:ferredoxin